MEVSSIDKRLNPIGVPCDLMTPIEMDYSMRIQEMTWTKMGSSVKCARKLGMAKVMPLWIHGTRAGDS